MKLENKLKRLVARLPARQQTLDFAGDNLWQVLPSVDQQACRRAIANLLLQVLQDEPHETMNNDTEENDDHE